MRDALAGEFEEGKDSGLKVVSTRAAGRDHQMRLPRDLERAGIGPRRAVEDERVKAVRSLQRLRRAAEALDADAREDLPGLAAHVPGDRCALQDIEVGDLRRHPGGDELAGERPGERAFAHPALERDSDYNQ